MRGTYRVVYDLKRCHEALFRLGLRQRDLIGQNLSETVISKFFRGQSVDPVKTAAPILRKLRLRMFGKGGVATLVDPGNKSRKTA